MTFAMFQMSRLAQKRQFYLFDMNASGWRAIATAKNGGFAQLVATCTCLFLSRFY